MSATAEKASDHESDHTLNTLTDVVRIVGETRADVKALDRKMDRLEQKVDSYQQENRERFENIDKRFENIDKRFEQQDQRFDQLEFLIRQLLPDANK